MRLIVRGISTAGIAMALWCCAGCQQQKTNADAAKSAKTGVDASLDSLSSEKSNSLAAQSQRDVDLILKSRGAAGVKPQNTTGDPASSPGAENSPSNTIIWNDSRALAAKNPSSDVHQPALARPTTDLSAAAEHATTSPDEKSGPRSETSKNTLAPDRMKSLMVDLSRELYANGAYSDTPLRQLLMIAAMSMIDPQRTIDPQAIPDLTEKERDLLAKLQSFFAELGKSLDGKKDTEQAIVEAVAKLRESLVKQPMLKLPTVALCTRVGGFGDYSPFEKYTFLAESQQKAIVYLEIENFTSELNQKSEYVTQIAQQLTIYSDRDGIPVWKEDWQTATDITKNKRQDFFTVQVITLPKALSVGKYQLKIRARDEKSQAEAEASITFEMVADPRMVGK